MNVSPDTILSRATIEVVVWSTCPDKVNKTNLIKISLQTFIFYNSFEKWQNMRVIPAWGGKIIENRTGTQRVNSRVQLNTF
jgi:hypothetical protein